MAPHEAERHLDASGGIGCGGMDPKEGCSRRGPARAAFRLDVETRPHERPSEEVADRVAPLACPDCKRACKAHDVESPHLAASELLPASLLQRGAVCRGSIARIQGGQAGDGAA